MTPPRRPTLTSPVPLPRARALAIAARVAVGCALLVAPTAAALAAGAAAPSQGHTALFLPDLQADLKASGALFAAPQGQEGLGNAVVDVQNLSDVATTLTLDLWPKSSTAPVAVRKGLGAGGAMRLDLAQIGDAEGGFYSGRLSAGEVLGGGAHVRWVSGATAAYEAAPAAHEFILPLIARTVYSHTTIIFAQNTDEDDPNQITMTLYDGEDGSIVNEATGSTEPMETFSWDTAHTENTFGPSALGSNAPTGGWIGHAWFQAGKPISVMAYGDELESIGSSAYLARPVGAADTVQYLPLVRAAEQGGSLIAVANAGHKAVDVTIDYQGAPFSPAGAGQTYRQSFKIAPRGVAFVDLTTRGRGTRPAPALPRPPGAGFVGAATVRASAPVLAVAQDEQLAAGQIDGVSAYNAYGPNDLGTGFTAVTVRKAYDYQSSVLYAYNPDYVPLEVTIDLFNASGAAAGQLTGQVPPGGLARWALADVATFPDGLGRARLRGSGSFAALVGDERDPRGKPAVVRHTVLIRPEGENHTSGVAILTEQGRDVVANLQISGTWPGATYKAEVRNGACGATTDVAHLLNDFTDKTSTTVLRNESIQALVASPHAFVLQSVGFRGVVRDIACGNVEPLAGAEVVDTTLAWPVLAAYGEAIATPTIAPTDGPPTAMPTRTPTPRPSATARPSATPGGQHYAWLPLAYK